MLSIRCFGKVMEFRFGGLLLRFSWIRLGRGYLDGELLCMLNFLGNREWGNYRNEGEKEMMGYR